MDVDITSILTIRKVCDLNKASASLRPPTGSCRCDWFRPSELYFFVTIARKYRVPGISTVFHNVLFTAERVLEVVAEKGHLQPFRAPPEIQYELQSKHETLVTRNHLAVLFFAFNSLPTTKHGLLWLRLFGAEMRRESCGGIYCVFSRDDDLTWRYCCQQRVLQLTSATNNIAYNS